jgi:hypothetical protein
VSAHRIEVGQRTGILARVGHVERSPRNLRLTHSVGEKGLPIDEGVRLGDKEDDARCSQNEGEPRYVLRVAYCVLLADG